MQTDPSDWHHITARIPERPMPSGLMQLDGIGRIVRCDARAAALFARQPADLVGRSNAVLFPFDVGGPDRPDVALEQARRAGYHRVIGQRQRQDGVVFWAQVTTIALRDSTDSIIGYGLIIDDIDDLVAVAPMADVANFGAMLLDFMVEGVITTSMDGSIRYFSRAAQSMFGYDGDELIGQNVKVLMPEPYRHMHDRYLADYRNTRRSGIIGIGGRELPMLRKDGSTFPAELAVGEASGPLGAFFVATVRDLTERKEAEGMREQLRQAQKMEAIGQLTGGIAHDFNNLLSVIIGHLELVVELGEMPASATRHVQPCIEAALRGADLTRRLLAFGRRQHLEPRPVQVNDLLSSLCQLVQRTLGERISVITQLRAQTRPAIVDLNQLENAVLNIVINARDAMQDGGMLIIETDNARLDSDYAACHADVEPGDYCMIAISDTGQGMPKAVVERVFEPFFTTKPAGQGTGLGLSMVHGFVKQSNGHVSIYSEVGHGTTIRLYLPQARDDRTETAVAPAAAELPLPPRGMPILIVEDDAQVREAIRLMIDDLGYEAHAAKDAASALRLLEERSIDVVLSDVVLAGEINGVALAGEIRRRHPAVKILFMSGYTDFALSRSQLLAGDAPLITKPFLRVELAARLQQCWRPG